MQVSARSYLTAGVAVLGAGAVALSPIQPVATSTALSPMLTKAVAINLAASIDPITPIIDTITTTFDNTTTLLSDWLATPFPIAQTVVNNWLYYFTELPDIGGIVSQVFGNIPNAIRAPFDPGTIKPTGLTNGDNISTIPVVPGFGFGQQDIFGLLPLIGPAFVTNNQSLLNFLNTPISGTLLGLVGPVIAPFVALGNGISGAIAAIQASDIPGAINDLINIPTHMINALLNGGVTLDLTPLLKSTLPASVTSIGFNLGGLLTTFTGSIETDQYPAGLVQVGGVGFDSLTFTTTAVGGFTDPGIPIGLAGGLVSMSRFVANAINSVPTPASAASKTATRRAPAAAARAATSVAKSSSKAASARSAAASRRAG